VISENLFCLPENSTVMHRKAKAFRPGINFTNILGAAFSYKSFVLFWHKNICAKAAHKMLVKLTTGINFTNVY
jgi:hypothetical protein